MGSIKSLQTGHVGLTVTDLDRSVTFYTTVFEFDVLGEGKEEERRFAFLGREGKAFVTLWQQGGGAYSAALAGLHHLAFQVETIDEVKAAEAVLQGLGAEFAYEGVVPHGEHGTSGGIFFTDPDGIRLEIYAPTGADPADAPTAGAPTCGFF